MRDEYGIRNIINQFQKEISYYSQMEVLGATSHEKEYNQSLIKERTEELIHVMEHYVEKISSAQQPIPENERRYVPQLPPGLAPPPFSAPGRRPTSGTNPVPGSINEEPVPEPLLSPLRPPAAQTPRVFTAEELKVFNGEGGYPAYVAVQGVVYDVSGLSGWSGGAHYGLRAGNDLSNEFMSCHGGVSEMLRQLPVIGVLVTG
jgi:predicted heme/steroid binding protein